MNRISCSHLTGRILSGRVNKERNAFTGRTTDVTSDVMKSIIEKLRYHGGTMQVTCEGKVMAEITLSVDSAPSWNTPSPPHRPRLIECVPVGSIGPK